MKTKILSIRTHYPHWGKYSGIQQYMNFLNADEFVIDEILTEMGNDAFWFQKGMLRDKLIAYIANAGAKAYELNDFASEMLAIKKSLFANYSVIQFFDGEHGLLFFPYWAKKLQVSKKAVVGMFHQPTKILNTIVPTGYLKHLDHIILMSEEQRKFFTPYVENSKITVIHHGVNTDIFSVIEKEFSSEKIICLTVGKWLRNYQVVFELAHRLSHDDKFEFHIVADVNQGSGQKNIFVHKGISDKELIELYQNADILLMPLNDATANNAILEGMACGLPVVSTDIQGVREYTDGAEAVLVRDNDVDQFEAALVELSHNIEQRKIMSQSSRRRALQLDWRVIAQQYSEFYMKLAEEKKSVR